MIKYQIYEDLDGCLVNFARGLKRLGTTIEALDKDPDGIWPIITAAGPEWWSELEWMADGKELWNHIKKHDPIILTAIPLACPQVAMMGKLDWINRELGPDVKCIFTNKYDKQLYANPTSILIDDHMGNIRRWIDSGGIGLLHPFNSSETIRNLKILGIN